MPNSEAIRYPIFFLASNIRIDAATGKQDYEILFLPESGNPDIRDGVIPIFSTRVLADLFSKSKLFDQKCSPVIIPSRDDLLWLLEFSRDRLGISNVAFDPFAASIGAVEVRAIQDLIRSMTH